MFGVGLPVPLLGLLMAARLFEQGAGVVHGAGVPSSGGLPVPVFGVPHPDPDPEPVAAAEAGAGRRNPGSGDGSSRSGWARP